MMKKLLSIHYSAFAFNAALLLLRVASGILLMSHGYTKLVDFSQKKDTFMDFLGMGSTTSLALCIFAEFFCALFVVIGLFTRAVSIPIVINMSVALFSAHNMDFFGEGEKSALFLIAFLTILLCGPGRASVDGIVSK
jgi:putative oxidoreductase